MGITINDVSARAAFTATASQTVFSLPFVCFSDSDLAVYQNGTQLTLATDYTVTGAGESSGLTVTLLTGATAGDAITVIREVPYDRTAEFATTGAFPIASLNLFLAKLVAMVQQLRDGALRALTLNPLDTDGSGSFDANSNRIGNLGTPSVDTDAATKGYVDDGDAALQTQIDNLTFDAGTVPTPTGAQTGYKLTATGAGAWAWVADAVISLTAYMTKAANLSDLTDVATARANLGLGSLATASTIGSGDITAKAVTFAKVQDIATGKLVGRSTASSGSIEEIAVGSGLSLAGGTLSATAGSNKSTVQIVESASGAVATGTTTIPSDNTIPQNTEGTQFLSATITPTSAANYLEIEVTAILSGSTASNFLAAALFQDSTANALAAAWSYGGTNETVCLTFKHRMLAGTTSATTFKVRGGINVAGTCTFNGYAAGQILGGVAASRIIVREIVA